MLLDDKFARPVDRAHGLRPRGVHVDRATIEITSRYVEIGVEGVMDIVGGAVGANLKLPMALHVVSVVLPMALHVVSVVEQPHFVPMGLEMLD